MIDTKTPVISIKAQHYFYYNGAEREPLIGLAPLKTCATNGPLKNCNVYAFLRSDTETLERFYVAYDLCEWLGNVFGLPLDA